MPTAGLPPTAIKDVKVKPAVSITALAPKGAVLVTTSVDGALKQEMFNNRFDMLMGSLRTVDGDGIAEIAGREVTPLEMFRSHRLALSRVADEIKLVIAEADVLIAQAVAEEITEEIAEQGDNDGEDDLPPLDGFLGRVFAKRS